MIRRSAALLLVAVLLAAVLFGGGIPVEAIPIASLGLVVVASPGLRSCDLSSFPASPALLALASSHRLPRASLIPRHI